MARDQQRQGAVQEEQDVPRTDLLRWNVQVVAAGGGLLSKQIFGAKWRFRLF
jgi:hypothetical protein